MEWVAPESELARASPTQRAQQGGKGSLRESLLGRRGAKEAQARWALRDVNFSIARGEYLRRLKLALELPVRFSD